MAILIIGGGNAAKTLINYFRNAEDLRIEAVVDINDEAPGMVYAREHEIETGNEVEEYIENPSVDIIVEVTGNSMVRESILELKKSHQEIMTAGAARILCEALENLMKTNADNAFEISNEFTNLTEQMKSIISNINRSITDVTKINSFLHMTSLNAMVEAARLGNEGRSFSVITDEMKKLSDNINEVLEVIQKASDQMHNILDDLDLAEERLKDIFSKSDL